MKWEQINNTIHHSLGMGALSRFAPYTLGSGVVLSSLQSAAKSSMFVQPMLSPCRICSSIKGQMFRWLNKEAGLPLDDGFMACFKLKHAFDGAINSFEGIRRR